MAKVIFDDIDDLDVGDIDELKSPDVYDGPVPPAAPYTVKLDRLNLKHNSAGNQMLQMLLKIDETGDKSKYNGYPIWSNQSITKQSAPFVKKFLDSLGVTWDEFKGKTRLGDGDMDDKLGVKIEQLGKLKIDGNTKLRITTKSDPYNGVDKLGVATFLPKGATQTVALEDVSDESTGRDNVEPGEVAAAKTNRGKSPF